METIEILKRLQNKIEVYWLAGNHDYHLLKLKNRAPHINYPFEFRETLELVEGGHTYRFMHGYEFEYGNEVGLIRPIMEMLCHVMSDSGGKPKNDIWASLAHKFSDIQYSIFTGHEEGNLKIMVQSIGDSPEERLKDRVEGIEKAAHLKAGEKPGQMLIFGHTHHPFISRQENLVNTGSWVKNSPHGNTYVVLQEGRPRLYIFGGDEIKERKEFTR